MKNVTLLSFKASRFKFERSLFFTSDGPFSVISGGRGMGKSTLLEALAFTGALFSEEKLGQAIFNLPGWLPDLVPGNCGLELVLLVDGHKLVWEAKLLKDGTDDPATYHPFFEKISIDGEPWISLKNDIVSCNGKKHEPLFHYSGSIFATFMPEKVFGDGPFISLVKTFVETMRRLYYAGSLDPATILDQTVGDKPRNIGWRGAATLECYHALSKTQKESVKRGLRHIFPWCVDFRTTRAGDSLIPQALALKNRWGKNDGSRTNVREDWLPASFWRVLAILTELESGDDIILFDELDTVLDARLAEEIAKRAREGKQVIGATSQTVDFKIF